MWQAQATATQIFANVLKASQLVLVFEGAVDYVPQLENKYTGGPVGLGLRLDGPGTNLSGNPHIGSYPQYPGLSSRARGFPTVLVVRLRRGGAAGVHQSHSAR